MSSYSGSNPWSYSPWPASCSVDESAENGSASSIRVVNRMSCRAIVVVNGWAERSCLPASKSKPMSASIRIVRSHWSGSANRRPANGGSGSGGAAAIAPISSPSSDARAENTPSTRSVFIPGSYRSSRAS